MKKIPLHPKIVSGLMSLINDRITGANMGQTEPNAVSNAPAVNKEQILGEIRTELNPQLAKISQNETELSGIKAGLADKLNRSEIEPLKAELTTLKNAQPTPANNSQPQSLSSAVRVFTQGKAVGIDELNAISATPYFRIPAIAITDDGTIVVLSDYRSNPKDQVKIGVVAAVSNNGGKSFNYTKVALPIGDDAKSRVMDSTVIAHKEKVFVLNGAWTSGGSNWTRDGASPDNFRAILSVAEKSSDYMSFNSTELTVNGKPAEVKGFLGGVGAGLVLGDGTLVFPTQFTKGSGSVFAGFIYSTDEGANWHWGNMEISGVSENHWVLDSNGYIVMIGRRDGSGHKDAYHLTNSNGEWLKTVVGVTGNIGTYELYAIKGKVKEPQGTQGGAVSFISSSGTYLCLFTAPQNRQGGYNRDHITLYATDLNSNLITPVEVLCHEAGASVGGIPYGGYACVCYSNGKNGEIALVAYESDLGICVKDITHHIARLSQIYRKDNLAVGVNGFDYCRENLMCEYKAKNLTPTSLPATNGMGITAKVYGNTKAVGDMISFNTTGINNNKTLDEKLKIVSHIGIDLRDWHTKLNTYEFSFDFDMLIPASRGVDHSWINIFQFGEPPKNMIDNRGKNWKAHLGLGYQKNQNNDTNLTINPQSDSNTRITFTHDSLKTGKRVHVCAVIKYTNPSSMKLYVDGVLVHTFEHLDQRGTKAWNYLVLGNDLFLEKNSQLYLGDIRFYSVALSEAQIQQNAKASQAKRKLKELIGA